MINEECITTVALDQVTIITSNAVQHPNTDTWDDEVEYRFSTQRRQCKLILSHSKSKQQRARAPLRQPSATQVDSDQDFTTFAQRKNPMSR